MKDRRIPRWLAIVIAIVTMNVTAFNAAGMIANPDGRTGVAVATVIASVVMVLIGAIADGTEY